MAVTSSRVTVTTSATALVPTDGSVASIVAHNKGSASIDIGGASITTGTGFELAAGEAFTMDLNPGEIPYGIAASGTVRVDVLRSKA